MKNRNGLRASRTVIEVLYFDKRVGLPWAEIKPLIASAFRHVQKEAFRNHGAEFIQRCAAYPATLFIHKSSYGWWGRNMGSRSRVFVGPLHQEPKQTSYPKFKDMPVFWHADWKEHLVGLVAHELWHRWQPGQGKHVETMCEVVEQDAIDAYRREHGRTFAPPTVRS